MNKQEFLSALQSKLNGLPQKDIDEHLNFYSEMLDDHILEDGVSEEMAVASLGDIDGIVEQILSDFPITNIVKEKMSLREKLDGWKIAVIVLTSPIWLSILAAVLGLFVSFYSTVLSVVITLWSVELALASSIVGSLVSAIIAAIKGNLLFAAFMLGMGFISAGLTILMFYVCKLVSLGVYQLSKKAFLALKVRLIRGGQTV